MSNETNIPIPPQPTVELHKLPPFPRFCCSIGMIPSSYKVAMSYEEQLMWLCKYLEETVIPTINENTDATNSIILKYNEIVEFLNNYFENLDVQQEINNKLDEMAENGYFEDILRAYVDDSFIQYFNNVDELKNANLTAGQIAGTLGYYSPNDGGNAKYLIVNDETLIDDGASVHDLVNGYKAKLLFENQLNVLQMGAKGDLINDDSPYFQKAIDLSYEYKIPVYIPSSKQFLIQNTLKVRYFRPIVFVGDFKCNYASETSYYCNIFCTTDFISRADDGNTDLRASIIMKNLAVCFWNNKTDKQPITNYAVFKNVILNDSLIENNLFVGVGYFIHNGSLKFVTKIQNNRFSNINKCFICTYDENNIPNSLATTNYISDSYISHNYINGNGSQNPVFIKGSCDNEADTTFDNNYIDYFKYLIDCTPATGNGMVSIGKQINNAFSSCFRVTPRVITGFFINNNFEGWNRTNINAHFTNQDEFMQNAKIGPFVIDPLDLNYFADIKTDFREVKLIDNTIANLDYFIFIISYYSASTNFMKDFYEKGTQNPYINEPANDMFIYKPWCRKW